MSSTPQDCECGAPLEYAEESVSPELSIPIKLNGVDYVPTSDPWRGGGKRGLWKHLKGGITCNQRCGLLRVERDCLVRVLYSEPWHRVLSKASAIFPQFRVEIFLDPNPQKGGPAFAMFVPVTALPIIRQQEPLVIINGKEVVNFDAVTMILNGSADQDEVDVAAVIYMFETND